MREQLLQSQKMDAVGQLTGGVAHDFNNLLTIVLGNLEIAQRNLDQWREGAQERIQRALKNATLGAERAATLTQRLLAFARRQPLAPTPVDVGRLLRSVEELVRGSLPESIDVEVVTGGGVWPVEADMVQLETVIVNLALNARDAMPQGGKLTIEAGNVLLDEEYFRKNPEASAGQYVRISVSDTGVGMTKDTLERAFEPFFTTKAVGEGTGLGLSQVYGFDQTFRRPRRDLQRVGEGTTVKMYLPRRRSRGRRQEAETPVKQVDQRATAKPSWSSKMMPSVAILSGRDAAGPSLSGDRGVERAARGDMLDAAALRGRSPADRHCPARHERTAALRGAAAPQARPENAVRDRLFRNAIVHQGRLIRV